MRKVKRKVSSGEDNVTISGSTVSIQQETDYFGSLSIDLIIKILSKLLVKPMAKCRCVSKQWSSIIRRPNYNQLFPIKSPPTPRLLLALLNDGKLFFYSSSQPQNPDRNSTLAFTHHHYTHSSTYVDRLCSSFRGFVCSQKSGQDYILAVISNPITGESLTTPRLTIIYTIWSKVKIYFGYDPVEQQFKVLCICYAQNSSSEYHVLTLGTGTGRLVWRKIQCCIPCYDISHDDGICIDGVLYLKAKRGMIVCFDVKSEKFSFININQGSESIWRWECMCLIDYKGKLGAIVYNADHHSSDLWVLEDAREHKWSKHSYKMPELSRPCLDPTFCVSFAGKIGTGEIVLYQKLSSDRFHIGCYNLETNTITTVKLEIPAPKWVKYSRFHIFTDFVEDVKLM